MGYRYYMKNRELWDSMLHNAAGVGCVHAHFAFSISA